MESPENQEPENVASETPVSPEETSTTETNSSSEGSVTDHASTDEPASTDAVSTNAGSDEADVPSLTLGQEGEEEEAPKGPQAFIDYQPVIRGRIDRFGVAMGTGRRKTSVARVRMKPGTGKMEINGKTMEEFLSIEQNREMVMAPLKVTDSVGKYDVWVRVNGGGTTGQTGAIVLGIARALQVLDPQNHLALAENGLLTRDDRAVERKKYGLRKARRSYQFSKR